MARKPNVFVRPLSVEEGQKLRRAIVVLMSGQGRPVRSITTLPQVSDDRVRHST